MGPSCNPYDKFFVGYGVNTDNTVADELRPYRSLDASRLKLSGEGNWDPCPFLTDDLVMAFRDPGLLELHRMPHSSEYPHFFDSEEEVAALAKVWDVRGLLHLHAGGKLHEESFRWVRMFNCFKGPLVDRQIGDRRGQNACEGRIRGPSERLPTGPDLQDLCVDPKTHKLCIAITDRRDFYHQLRVTLAKARLNSVGPPIRRSLLVGTEALKSFDDRQLAVRPSRAFLGDRLPGVEPRTHDMVGKADENAKLFVSFKSVLQGDHTGVDVATCAHATFLEGRGLLEASSRFESGRALRDSNCGEGLCIDDYFAISKEPLAMSLDSSRAAEKFREARHAYHDVGLKGSDDKDILATKAKAVGAQVNSGEDALKRNLVTLGAPVEKRLALSLATLRLVQMSHTTDVLHLCLVGGWISAFMYRRPLMSLFHEIFSLVDARAVDADMPKTVPLSRKAANELVLAAVLFPLAVFELSAPFHDRVFCSDASSGRGAFCSAELSTEDYEVLWRTSRSKGSFTRLLSPVEEVLHKLNEREEFEDQKGPREVLQSVKRPLAFRFAFIEVFAGSARVTAAMAKLGYVVGPPIDISRSEEHDVSNVYVIRWLSHLIVEHYIEAFIVEPPCTSFSIMRRPALRDKVHVFGFRPDDPQTATGNSLAQRSLQMMSLGDYHGVPGVHETPNSSKMKNLPSYQHVKNLPSATSCRTDSCRFASPHLKSFAFLGVHVCLRPLSLRCQCEKKHLVVQGQYTQSSATYTFELADALAGVLANAIERKRRELCEDSQQNSDGLESLFVNQIALESPWQVEASWKFRGERHINILEMTSVLKLVERLAQKRRPLRFCDLVDSNVVRCALQKGRTSSFGLAPIVAKINSIAVAAGLCGMYPFVPTRLNPSDDPTREVDLRAAQKNLSLSSWSKEEKYELAEFKRSRKWAANWCRLVLIVLGPRALTFTDRKIFRVPRCDPEVLRDFDSTLGFPGEGHSLSLMVFLVLVPLVSVLGFSRLACFGRGFWWTLWTSLFCCLSGDGRWFLFLGGGFGCVVRSAEAMPLFPRNSGDWRRASARQNAAPLPVGRPVTQTTNVFREKLVLAFKEWVSELDIDVDVLLADAYHNVEEINTLLSRYGRCLYEAGRPLNHYSETVNAVASLKPQLRRTLQGAWDLAYSWVRQEPPCHHTALPSQVLMAILTVSMCWGWMRFAGCIALGWGGVLRAGEILSAKREDLLLPSDTGYSSSFALLAISEPKTRFSAARHQSAKLDIPDLLQIVEICFSKLKKHEPLWPWSGQTMRLRLRQVCNALKLPEKPFNGIKPLDLGSLRAGGATWLLQSSESGDLVMRRGRWSSYRMMSIYVQEVAAVSFLAKIPPDSKEKILAVMSFFPEMLRVVAELDFAQIPVSVWPILFAQQQTAP